MAISVTCFFSRLIPALALCVLALPACGWKGRSGPSTLVIAVDNLGFEDVSCESDDLTGREYESFRSFCEDGVRFTHAFTTSTMSQPALASILTGYYPLEHGVRTNGREGLSPQLTTVSEMAAQEGFRTGLFSGGPPILRKSGMSQGFEVFDDNFPVPPRGFFRPAHEVSRLFTNWLDRSVAGAAYFAVLYFADLQFPEAATVSDLGEMRERSRISQVREVAESLTSLMRDLRERGLWHRTHVILVGLSGKTFSRAGDIPPLNLYGENTQVALFLKPARKTRDQGPHWTIDKNLSLADVGKSLFDFVGAPAPEPLIDQLPRVTLYPLIEQPRAEWSDNRLILIESSWGSWRSLSTARFAARFRQYFYIHDAQPKVYNTLLDRLEQNPLPPDDPLWTTLRKGQLSFFDRPEIAPWRIFNQALWQKNIGAQRWWRRRADLTISDLQTRRWMAAWLLQQAEWDSLLKFAEEQNDPLFAFVAKRNLGQSAKAPSGPCLGAFHLRRNLTPDRNCQDEIFGQLLKVLTSEDRQQRERAMDSFLRQFNVARWEFEAGAANYARYLPWDVSVAWPKGIQLSELFLALPENKALRDEVRSRRSWENRAFDL